MNPSSSSVKNTEALQYFLGPVLVIAGNQHDVLARARTVRALIHHAMWVFL
jgi:hypothetical protein